MMSVIVFVMIAVPFFAHAQDSSLESEMRSTLRSAEGGASLSDSDFNLLSDALVGRARESSVTADDIALSRIESTLSASAVARGGVLSTEGQNDWIVPSGALIFLVILGILSSLWQKMHHGGALGPTGTGVSGLHKPEAKRLPWVR